MFIWILPLMTMTRKMKRNHHNMQNCALFPAQLPKVSRARLFFPFGFRWFFLCVYCLSLSRCSSVDRLYQTFCDCLALNSVGTCRACLKQASWAVAFFFVFFSFFFPTTFVSLRCGEWRRSRRCWGWWRCSRRHRLSDESRNVTANAVLDAATGHHCDGCAIVIFIILVFIVICCSRRWRDRCSSGVFFLVLISLLLQFLELTLFCSFVFFQGDEIVCLMCFLYAHQQEEDCCQWGILLGIQNQERTAFHLLIHVLEYRFSFAACTLFLDWQWSFPWNTQKSGDNWTKNAKKATLSRFWCSTFIPLLKLRKLKQSAC